MLHFIQKMSGVSSKNTEEPFYSETQSQQNRCTFSQDMSSAELFLFVSKSLAFHVISSVYAEDTMLSCVPMQLQKEEGGSPSPKETKHHHIPP
ncbi:Transmembrane protein 69 [Apodemus speciosus]|uniref:Transmembrane protein 69 n=1 Tax=Apodemus speciosus TaxID=105296 RepID=A0ABQ0EP02_APOSI